MEPEYRKGTPTKAMHEARTPPIPVLGLSIRPQSTWLVKGQLFIALTDGENWWKRPSKSVGESWCVNWYPSGNEEWCPCEDEAPIPWATDRVKEHAVALRAEGDEEVRAWSCGTCGVLFAAAHKHLAERCHGPRFCEWPNGCTDQPQKGRLYCAKHDAEVEADKKRQAFKAAEKIDASDYRGWVFWDADPHGEGFYASLDDLFAHCRYFDMEPPEYVWACNKKKPGSDAEEIIENALSDHHEGASSDIGETRAQFLQKFLDLWWGDTGIVTYTPSKTLAVIVRRTPTRSSPEAIERVEEASDCDTRESPAKRREG